MLARYALLACSVGVGVVAVALAAGKLPGQGIEVVRLDVLKAERHEWPKDASKEMAEERKVDVTQPGVRVHAALLPWKHAEQALGNPVVIDVHLKGLAAQSWQVAIVRSEKGPKGVNAPIEVPGALGNPLPVPFAKRINWFNLDRNQQYEVVAILSRTGDGLTTEELLKELTEAPDKAIEFVLYPPHGY